MATTAAKHWTRVLDEQEASGLTMVDDARRHDLNVGSLYAWRRRLGRTRKRPDGHPFLEVVVPRPATTGVTVRLPACGVEFGVSDPAQLGLVRQLVDALC